MGRAIYSVLLGFVSVFMLNFVAYTAITLYELSPVAFFDKFIWIDVRIIMAFQFFMMAMVAILHYLSSSSQFFTIDSEGNIQDIEDPNFLDKQE